MSLSQPSRRSSDHLLAKEDNLNLWQEFIELLSMSIQVSMATVTRIALTSIDTAFLGQLGTNMLAASSLAQTWTSVPLMAVWAGASALITLCGQAWGAGNKELTGIWLQFGLIVTGLFGIPVFIWYWCIGIAMHYSTPDQDVRDYGVLFARALSFSIAPSLAYACLRQYFQAMGIMWPTTLVGTLSIGVTFMMNYVLIYGVAGWGGLGFVGSPLATVVASWFQLIFLVLICIVWKKYHVPAWNGWSREALTTARLGTFLSIAGPIASNSLLSSIANSIITLIAARMGTDVIAANSVCGSLWSILWALFWGFGCSTQVKVANYMGAGRPHAARKMALLGLFCSFATVVVLMTAIFFLNRKVFRIYTSDPHIIDMCCQIMMIWLLSVFVQTIEILSAAVLTGMGKVKIILYVSVTGTWLIEAPLAAYFGLKLEWGLKSLWLAVVIMEVYKLAAYVIALARVDWVAQAKATRKAMESSPDDDAVDEEEGETKALLGGSNGNAANGAISNPRSMERTLNRRTASTLSQAMSGPIDRDLAEAMAAPEPSVVYASSLSRTPVN